MDAEHRPELPWSGSTGSSRALRIFRRSQAKREPWAPSRWSEIQREGTYSLWFCWHIHSHWMEILKCDGNEVFNISFLPPPLTEGVQYLRRTKHNLSFTTYEGENTGRKIIIETIYWREGAFQVVLVVKNPPANVRGIRDTGLIPGSGRSPGEGQGNPLQYSCLENPMDRGALRATVHRVPKNWLKRGRDFSIFKNLRRTSFTDNVN